MERIAQLETNQQITIERVTDHEKRLRFLERGAMMLAGAYALVQFFFKH